MYQSPDLNIIEGLWSELKATVVKRRPANVEELWQICEEEWARISVEKIKKLYQSLPRRIEQVIKMTGRTTNY